MQLRKNNPFVKWWFAPNFPDKQLDNIFSYKPRGLKSNLRNLLRTWFVHPIKRRLAKYYLIFLRRVFGLKVIGITGSAGKTSTKEILASILELEGNTVYSFANIDPIYNIPTTILKCSFWTRYLILEMGVEYPDEMDFYLWMATPDIGVITNIFPTHTKFFGDSAGVFREKSKLVKNLNANSFAVLNKNDKFLIKLTNLLKSKVVWFGKGGEVMSSLEKINKDLRTEFLLTINKDSKKLVKVVMPVVGLQYVSNALAASAIAKTLGVKSDVIKKGLEKLTPPPHRMSVIKHKSGALILDDSYNNNPEAAKASLLTLSQVSKGQKRIFVFGDMLELGNKEYKYHKELGKYISQSNIRPQYLVCIGSASKITAEVASEELGKEHVSHFESVDNALPFVKSFLRNGNVILVKGSRSMGLDKLIDSL